MTETTKREWTVEEIEKLPMERGLARGRIFKDDKEDKPRWIEFRKESADGLGDYLIRAFRRINDHYIEVDVKAATKLMAGYLAEKISSKTILKEILVKLDGANFCELLERVEKEPRVTLGIRKGSCAFLYVRGKQGAPLTLQVTE